MSACKEKRGRDRQKKWLSKVKEAGSGGGVRRAEEIRGVWEEMAWDELDDVGRLPVTTDDGQQGTIFREAI